MHDEIMVAFYKVINAQKHLCGQLKHYQGLADVPELDAAVSILNDSERLLRSELRRLRPDMWRKADGVHA